MGEGHIGDFYNNINYPADGDGSQTSSEIEFGIPEEKPAIDDIDNLDHYIGAQITMDDTNENKPNLATNVA